MRSLDDDYRDLHAACREVRRADTDENVARHDAAIARLNDRELERVERESAAESSRGTWGDQDRRNSEGEAYLARRGFEPRELVAADAVRFDASGDPCVALHAFDAIDSQSPINIVTRRRAAADPSDRVRGRRGCPTRGTLVGRIEELDRDGVDVAVIVEGVTDSLAATLAFPGCAVLGAHGAGNMPAIAEAVAPRLVEIRGWLLLVVDADADHRGPGAGERAGLAAARIAIAAGLDLARSFRLVDIGGEKDLTEAYARGWRWSW